MRKITELWAFVVFTLLSSTVLLALHFFPASYWLDVRRIHVESVPVGASPPMVVDRDIRHEFPADWTVSVRQWDDGGWVVFCNATGTSIYKPKAKFPPKLDLKWWTAGQCQLPEGKYLMTTTWILRLDGLMPSKHVTTDSNVFQVRGL